MEKQVVERLTLENLFSTTSTESLAQGYILNCKSEGKSPKTIAIYETVLRNFIWYCKQNNFPEIHQQTSVHVRHFLWYLSTESNRWGSNNPAARKPASQTTVSDYYRALYSFFSWLSREQLISQNPLTNMKKPKPDKKVIQALTPGEIDSLFKECSGNNAIDVRNKAILSIFIDCGLRVSELANLSIDDVNVNNGSVLVRHGKGNKQRVVRIGVKAQKALWKYIALYRHGNNSNLFLNRNGETLDVVGIKIMIKRLGNRAKVKVHPHKLRHTFAISFLRAGGDVFSLQYLLGHSTLQMTQRYLQSLNANDAANAHKKFSPLDNMKI
jgi:site-specific recombinase XerD